MMQFFDRMLELVRSQSGGVCDTVDQHLLTYLAATRKDELNITVYEHWDGQAITLVKACKNISTHRDGEGLLVGNEGQIMSIIHKRDKCRAAGKVPQEFL